MRIFLTLLFKELRALFYSPVAWVVMALVMAVNGFSFRAAIAVLESGPRVENIVTLTFHPQFYWFWLSYFFIFPLLTMRLFAEERKMGTFETLFTAPVHTWQVIAAKYSASVFFYCILWLPSLGNFLLFRWMISGNLDLPAGVLYSTYLLIFFMGLFNLAAGCFASSLTSNQIVAATTSFTISVMHFMLGIFVLHLTSRVNSVFIDFTHYFASIEHIGIFTSGLVDTRVLVYYSSFSLLFLVLTHHVLEFRRWRL